MPLEQIYVVYTDISPEGYTPFYHKDMYYERSDTMKDLTGLSITCVHSHQQLAY